MRFRNRLRIIVLAVLFLGLPLIAIACLGWYALFTSEGASLIVKAAARHFLSPEDLRMQTAEGSLMEGLQLKGLALFDPAELPSISSIAVGQASVEPISPENLAGMQLKMENLEISLPGRIHHLLVTEAQGQPSGQWILQDLEMRGIRGLPEDSFVRIQEVRTTLPPTPEGLERIRNGRLFIPGEAPVVFDVSKEGDAIKGKVFTESVDVENVIGTLFGSQRFGSLSGVVEDVTLSIVKRGDHLNIQGPGRLARLDYKSFILEDSSGEMAFDVFLGDPVTTSGVITVRGGKALARRTVLSVESARMTFGGKFAKPVFDVAAVTNIEGTRIKIKFQGTVDEPKINLTSEPPRPHGVLLVMLATGRSWKPAEQVMDKGADPELLRDFVDYWVLGGLGNKVTSRFGVELLGLKLQKETKGIEVQKAVSDNVKISTGIELKQDPVEEQSTMKQSIGASYRLDDDTRIQLKAERETTQGKPTEPLNGATQQKQVNDEILLKLKKDF